MIIDKGTVTIDTNELDPKETKQMVLNISRELLPSFIKKYKLQSDTLEDLNWINRKKYKGNILYASLKEKISKKSAIDSYEDAENILSDQYIRTKIARLSLEVSRNSEDFTEKVQYHEKAIKYYINSTDEGIMLNDVAIELAKLYRDNNQLNIFIENNENLLKNGGRQEKIIANVNLGSIAFIEGKEKDYFMYYYNSFLLTEGEIDRDALRVEQGEMGILRSGSEFYKMGTDGVFQCIVLILQPLGSNDITVLAHLDYARLYSLEIAQFNIKTLINAFPEGTKLRMWLIGNKEGGDSNTNLKHLLEVLKNNNDIKIDDKNIMLQENLYPSSIVFDTQNSEITNNVPGKINEYTHLHQLKLLLGGTKLDLAFDSDNLYPLKEFSGSEISEISYFWLLKKINLIKPMFVMDFRLKKFQQEFSPSYKLMDENKNASPNYVLKGFIKAIFEAEMLVHYGYLDDENKSQLWLKINLVLKKEMIEELRLYFIQGESILTITNQVFKIHKNQKASFLKFFDSSKYINYPLEQVIKELEMTKDNLVFEFIRHSKVAIFQDKEFSNYFIKYVLDNKDIQISFRKLTNIYNITSKSKIEKNVREKIKLIFIDFIDKDYNNNIMINGKTIKELNESEIIEISNLYASLETDDTISEVDKVKIRKVNISIKEWQDRREALQKAINPKEFIKKIDKNTVDIFNAALKIELDKLDPDSNLADKYMQENINYNQKVYIEFEKISRTEDRYVAYVTNEKKVYKFIVEENQKDMINYIKEYNKILHEDFKEYFKE